MHICPTGVRRDRPHDDDQSVGEEPVRQGLAGSRRLLHPGQRRQRKDLRLER